MEHETNSKQLNYWSEAIYLELQVADVKKTFQINLISEMRLLQADVVDRVYCAIY